MMRLVRCRLGGDDLGIHALLTFFPLYVLDGGIVGRADETETLQGRLRRKNLFLSLFSYVPPSYSWVPIVKNEAEMIK